MEVNRVTPVFYSQAPWVVGRPTLLEHALDDFDGEVTRQRPWLRARFEAVLERLQADLDLEHDGATPLAAVTPARLDAWLAAQPEAERDFDRAVLEALAAYLVGFGWVEPAQLPDMAA